MRNWPYSRIAVIRSLTISADWYRGMKAGTAASCVFAKGAAARKTAALAIAAASASLRSLRPAGSVDRNIEPSSPVAALMPRSPGEIVQHEARQRQPFLIQAAFVGVPLQNAS